MPPVLETPRLKLLPVGLDDEAAISALLRRPEVRRFLCDDEIMPSESVRAVIADSLDPSTVDATWRLRLASSDGELVGIVSLQPPSIAALRLRAIGWRSLELVIALAPAVWGRGLATEAVAAVAGHARADGVTFALVAGVDAPNARSHALMRRCGFAELGHAEGPKHALVIYELAL